MANLFKCPTDGCDQNINPVYTLNPIEDNECGACGAHAPTHEVSE